MKAVWARVLVLSFLATGAMVLSALAVSENASAASVSGTWSSRVSGEGYTQTYLGLTGGMITDYFDAELVLTDSGGAAYGTLTVSENGLSKSYDVEGVVTGNTFYLSFQWGWDGVTYCDATYTLTIDGSLMYGGGSYINVGVTVSGYFDLEKESLFSAGGITPVVSAGSMVIAIVAIVLAATPGRVPPTGFRPQLTRVPPAPSPYTPSQQWTTEVPQQPMTGDGTVPQGGAGLQYSTPAPPGRPFPPKEHFTKVSQEPPRCPVHGDVALTPHYSTDIYDQGSWYCPKCRGYPWGKN